MGLSWQQGPLAPGAAGHFLVPDPLPERLLFAEPLRRRMRVRFGGTWIADSENVVLLDEVHPVAKRLGIDAEPVADPGDRPTRFSCFRTELEDHLHCPFPQLSGMRLPGYHEPQLSQRSQPPRNPGQSTIPCPAHYPSWLPAGGFDHRAAAAGLNSARLTAVAGRSYDRTRREPAADGGEPGMEQKWQPSTTATRP
jgi:hypothetical protein